jgi:hypothetical protein
VKKAVLIACGLVVAMIVGLMSLVFMIGGSEDPNACGPDPALLNAAGVSGPIPASVGKWKREQLVNAAAIINAGAEVGVSLKGQRIGVMTAMGESGLRVLNYGDAAGPDSRGLFQQRGNGAWGSLADRMDPRRSAMNFFKALKLVPSWESLPPTIAAHRVQINADPYYYEQFYDDAVSVVDALARTGGGAQPVPVSGSGGGSVGSGDPYNLGKVQPQLRAMVNALAPKFNITTVGGYRPSATDPQGHPAGLAADFMVPMTQAGKAQGAALASYARQNAGALNIDYILWQQQIWSTARAGEGWRPMENRGSDTANHRDHVHINVKPTGSVSSTLPAVLQGGFGPNAAACANDVGASAGGAVVYPVDKNTDRRNWHTMSSMRASWHTGTDFSIACGTPVRAAHGGTISVESSSWAGPHLTKVSTGPTSLTTWYGHMQSVSVKTGDVVTAGQQIGTVGSLGNSSGCHLHLEVHEKNGSIYGPDNVNPTTWLAKHVGTFLGGAGTVPPAGIRVVQADAGQRGTALAKKPDIVTWTDAASSSSSDLRPRGYGSWRGAAVSPSSSSRATAISWRSSRWEPLGKGRFRITRSPVSRDNTFAHWVVLRDRASGTQVSVVAVEAMADPAKYRYGSQTRTKRQATYRAGMKTLAAAINQLRAFGPVIVAGDFNSPYKTHGKRGDPWGPQTILGAAGAQSTYRLLGSLRGANDEYVLTTPDLVPVRQRTLRPGATSAGLTADLVVAGQDPR